MAIKHYKTRVGSGGKTEYLADPGYRIVFDSSGKPEAVVNNPAAGLSEGLQHTNSNQWVSAPATSGATTTPLAKPAPTPGAQPTPTQTATGSSGSSGGTSAPTSAPQFGPGVADPANGGNVPVNQAAYDPFGTANMFGTILESHQAQVENPNNQFMRVDQGGGFAPSTHTATLTTGYTPTQYIQKFATSSMSNRSDFEQSQAMLKAAGYYNSNGYVKGVYGSEDRTAMANAMNDYLGLVNQNSGVHMTFQQYLQMRSSAIKSQGGFGGGGGGRLPLTISYTDPAALKDALNTGAQSALGRNLTDSEMGNFISGFHSKEAAAQRRAYAGGGSATMPNATGQATQFIDQNFAKEEAQRESSTYLDALASVLGVKG